MSSACRWGFERVDLGTPVVAAVGLSFVAASRHSSSASSVPSVVASAGASLGSAGSGSC